VLWNEVIHVRARRCLDGDVCPAGMKKCGLTSTYACYNNNTQSCVNNQLVSAPGKDDRTSVGYCKPGK
jgi:hypothetical protein